MIHTLFLPDFDVSLECSSADLFYRNEPIVLTHKATKHDIFLYCPTASDKEDWFFVIQRASRLPEFADDAAAAAFHRDLEPVKAFDQGLQKLIYTLNTESEKSPNTPIWLNALLGRAFIGIRSNPQIKAWIMETITLRMAHVQRNSSSILGDIVIKDLDVGDSLPILSNPKLVSLTPEGTITMELDVDYTGGISLDAATVASISVNAWTQYMKPITVPIIVRITITRFFARMLVKMKPFWESDRVWFGFYRHPEVVLELKVEPVISSKLVQSDLVNSVIEKRIKEALEEFLILPNMDALVFWPFPDEIWMEEGAGADGTQDALSQDLDDSPRPMSLSLSEQGFESHQKSLRKAQSQKLVLNKAGLQREFKFTQWIKSLRAAEHDGARDLSSKEAQDDSDSLTSSSPVKSAPLETQILTVAGDTAFKVGQIVRTYGIDSTARSVARKVSSNLSILAGPAVEFIDDKTRAYRDKVYNDSVQLGLGIVDSLGLKPSPQDSFASLPPLLTQVGQLETGSESDREFVSSRLSASSPSKVLDILGVSISTSAPPVLNEGGSSSMRRKKAVTRTRSNMSMVSDQAGTGGDSEERRSLVAQWEKAVGRS